MTALNIKFNKKIYKIKFINENKFNYNIQIKNISIYLKNFNIFYIKFLLIYKYKKLTYILNNKFLKYNLLINLDKKNFINNSFVCKKLNIKNHSNLFFFNNSIALLEKYISFNLNFKFINKYSNSIFYNQYNLNNIINNINNSDIKIKKFNYLVKNELQGIEIINSILNLKKKNNLIFNNNYFINNYYLLNLINNKNNNKIIYCKNNLFNNFEIIKTGYYIKFNGLNLNEYLSCIFKSNLSFLNKYKSTYNSLINSYYILLNSFYYQYKKQNILLNIKNFEIILKKTINYVKIVETGDSNYTLNDILTLQIINMINLCYIKNSLKLIKYCPILLNFNYLSKYKTSNLCSISFQNTLKFIINNTINKNYDWLTDIKSNIISNNSMYFSNHIINKFKK